MHDAAMISIMAPPGAPLFPHILDIPIKTILYFLGPTKYMTEDFWRMLWQYSIKRVVMVTNLVEKGIVSNSIENMLKVRFMFLVG